MCSVGAGCGTIDSKILQLLLANAHPKLRTVILDPDSHMMQQYQELARKESTILQGVDFDWRQQTFQEYQANAKEDEKFHLISCISSIYYCGDLGNSLKFLYEKLHHGGLLLITLTLAESGFGRLWKFLSTALGKDEKFLMSSDIQEACVKLNIPIAQIQTVKTYSDITSCFDAAPDQLSQESKQLLDFLTHTVNFIQDAPVKLRDDVLRLLRSPECSETGPDGKVNFDESNAVFVIRRE